MFDPCMTPRHDDLRSASLGEGKPFHYVLGMEMRRMKKVNKVQQICDDEIMTMVMIMRRLVIMITMVMVIMMIVMLMVVRAVTIMMMIMARGPVLGPLYA